MWADMAIEGGLALLRNGLAYNTAKQNAEDRRAWQAYKNAMTNLANANNQNALTTNENMMRDRHADTAFGIERTAYMTTGAAEVAAAASGTGGRSVNAVLFDVERNASGAKAKNDRDLEEGYMQIDNQREASAFAAATQQDYSPIPMPSKAVAMLGLGTDLGKIYQRYNR